MTLTYFKCTDFRCLQSAELQPAARYNLIYGANASGKTSLLEAIAYLGRGKSFRNAPTERLIRHGLAEFVLFGRVRTAEREQSLGVRNGRQGLEISVDGDREGGAAALAEVLPLQVVDPDVHNLVAGGPEHRRRFLDWVAFHVEHGYLERWRRFRRVLRQRNACLRSGVDPAVGGWDREFGRLGLEVHEARLRVLDFLRPILEETGKRVLGEEVGLEYRQGWVRDESLEQALSSARDREQQAGSSQAGPHRADLRLVYDERQARKLVSRGQQKLLACAMTFAACRVVQEQAGLKVLLLLDDPAAELDAGSLQRLMHEVAALGSQVIATSLVEDQTLFPEAPATFHVEQGHLTPR